MIVRAAYEELRFEGVFSVRKREAQVIDDLK
jgi:hypothetical protein